MRNGWRLNGQNGLVRAGSVGLLSTDGAYISAEALAEAKAEGWDLVGPAQPSPGARGQPGLYRIEAFEVKLRQGQALCPQGKVSTECSKLTEKETGKVTYRFEFGRQCQTCPVKHLCVPKGQPHRMIRVGASHEVLQERRREQQTEDFKLRMHQRNGIEGTISELVRGAAAAPRGPVSPPPPGHRAPVRLAAPARS